MEEHSLTEDRLFTDFFGRQENKRYLEYMLEVLLDLEEDSLHGKLTFESTLERENIESKTNRCDIVYETEEILYNLEMYSLLDEKAFSKSTAYVITLSNNKLVKQERYHPKKKLIQINIARHVSEEMESTCEQCLTLKPLNKYVNMIIIRLDCLEKVDYNRNRSEDYIRLLKFLKAETQEEREKISKGNGVLESMCIDIPSRMDTELDPAFFNFDAWDKFINDARREEVVKEGIAIGEERGITIGEERAENKLIQKMISKGKSDEEIADTTEIDIKRIQELRAAMC